MTQTATPAPPGDDLRARILADPDVILSDRDVMKALIDADHAALGSNVVDLRGIAMGRLEERLQRLESTHRSVVAAAYDNLAGMNTIHRAVLRLLAPESFAEFLQMLGGSLADTLQVESVRLVLETRQSGADPVLARLSDVVVTAEPGFIAGYLSTTSPVPAATEARPRAAHPALGHLMHMAETRAEAGAAPRPLRRVTLRLLAPGTGMLHGTLGGLIASEACLRLDLGAGRLPGMLVLGAVDGQQFRPSHGTDLLEFLTDVFERVMLRWLG